MDKDLTKEKEKSPIENVFFGLEEDMNGKSHTLLSGKPEEEKKVLSMDEIEQQDEQEVADKEKKAKEALEAMKPPPMPPPDKGN